MTTSAQLRLEELGLSQSCLEFVRHVWDFLDEEISPDGAQRLKAHLEQCEQCRSYGDYQSCFFSALAKLKSSINAPAELRAKLADKLRSEGCGCVDSVRRDPARG